MKTLKQMLIDDNRALTVKNIIDITKEWLQQKQPTIKECANKCEYCSGRQSVLDELLEELNQ